MNTAQRVGIVTGGAGKIGRAVACELLARGVVDQVWSIDRHLTSAAPDKVIERASDLRNEEELAELVTEGPKRVHILVNVVGGETYPPVADVLDTTWPPVAVWNDIFDLNMTTPYRVIRAFDALLADGASVCTVSSIAASMPWVVSPAYGAAKAALEHWSKSMAAHFAVRGIRFNVVRPGFVWSQQWRAVDRAAFEAVVDDRVPLRQNGHDGLLPREQLPEDVASAVAFLCSPESRHLTAQSLDIDGGATLVRAAR